MSGNLRHDPVARRYQTPRPVASAAYPSLTPNAAHQKALKVERDYLALVQAAARKGDRAKLLQLRTRVAIAEAETPASDAATLRREFAEAHQASLTGSALRMQVALNGLTQGDEDRLLQSLYVEIGEYKDLIAVLEARKAAR